MDPHRMKSNWINILPMGAGSSFCGCLLDQPGPFLNIVGLIDEVRRVHQAFRQSLKTIEQQWNGDNWKNILNNIQIKVSFLS